MEKTNETAADGLLSLEQKLTRAQASIATLQAQHSAEKEAMESMANDIAEVLAIQEDMGCRLIRLSESQQCIYDTAGHARDLLTELPHDHLTTPLSCDEPAVAAPPVSLAEEFVAAASCSSRLSSELMSLVAAEDGVALRSGDNTESDAKVDAASSHEHDARQPSSLATTAVSSRVLLITATRLSTTYMTALYDVRVRMIARIRQWTEDTKAKPFMKNFREQFRVSASRPVRSVY